MTETNSTKKYIIRTYSAGVWYGNIKQLEKGECILQNARRIWYWSGAASLSELAVYGTKSPSNCKFCVTIKDEGGIYLPNVIEVLPVTKEAQANIDNVPEWRA
ncbi:MAG: DUF6948 domain-containing protein [Alphaproteobacteria bacterium]